MKLYKFLMLLSIVTLVITLLASTSPLYAAAHEEPTKVWPPPITDPSKAVPFSHPLDNTLIPLVQITTPQSGMVHQAPDSVPLDKEVLRVPSVLAMKCEASDIAYLGRR